MPATTIILTALVRRERRFIAECPELGISVDGATLPHALGKLKQEAEDYLYALGPDLHHTLEMLRRAAMRAQPHASGVLIQRFSVEVEQE